MPLETVPDSRDSNDKFGEQIKRSYNKQDHLTFSILTSLFFEDPLTFQNMYRVCLLELATVSFKFDNSIV